ncbi:MAG: tRNA (guanine(10)-N(2))-dimethyltransferase [Candidatus Altiarchaeales archaeon]|nr:tRNA (guanine(10)-N(2))-dimethyltransferase [Candidatus Altiarchaeales archaeon]MBD3415952.1 tRNA (guanine(10)-N(2))-dimethyltransferase [Candidatus Altiarchaeales archaeon]
MQYHSVVEGSTRLKVPVGGGVTKREEVFYNPHMALNRDLTVALCKRLNPGSFLDLMAGTGARGLRVACESGVDVTLNDLNPRAVDLIGENARSNGLDVSVENIEARRILADRMFDYVDVDPFGTPVEFVESAVSSVRRGGVLGVCATDTSALCGSYPRACMRKYDATPLRCDCYDEIGLRILVGFIARTAMRQGRGVEPLLSHSTRHYIRCQVRVVGRPSQTLKNLSYLQYCFNCLWRGYRRLEEIRPLCECGGELRVAGPLWSGRCSDQQTCNVLADEILSGNYGCRSEASRLLELLAGEQTLNLPYYDLHKLCSRNSVSAPPMKSASKEAESLGFMFLRVHFNSTGFKTDMPIGQLGELIRG